MTEPPKTAMDLMNRGLVIPIVVLDRAVDAVPLARALLAGGIDRATSADYLAVPNVACVGGSWLTPSDLVAAQDWDAVTVLAADVTA
jgi:2-keto-3-deoxy-6-phosphogluconate aldolase